MPCRWCTDSYSQASRLQSPARHLEPSLGRHKARPGTTPRETISKAPKPGFSGVFQGFQGFDEVPIIHIIGNSPGDDPDILKFGDDGGTGSRPLSNPSAIHLRNSQIIHLNNPQPGLKQADRG